MFSMALDSWRPSSSARSSRSSSPPVSTRTPSKTIVPSARRQPRSGTVTVAVDVVVGRRARFRRACGASPRRRRERVVGADADAARDVGRIGRGLQHEMTRAAIVDPDRRAVGAEQPVGAVAEDVEAGGEVQRRREAAGELVEQRADVALQLVALAQAEQLERGHERVGRPRRRRRRRSTPVGGVLEADREQADALVAADERQQQRRRACRAAPRGPASGGARRRRASAARRANASATSAASSGAGHPRVGPQRVEAESRRRLQRAVARVVLEQQRARCRR